MPMYDGKCPTCGRTEEYLAPSSAIKESAPMCCDVQMAHVWLPSTRQYVVRDIEAYQAMGIDVATGSAPMITSRSQHREYLRRNGYTEIGNEAMPLPPDRHTMGVTARDRRELGFEIKRAIDQKGIKL